MDTFQPPDDQQSGESGYMSSGERSLSDGGGVWEIQTVVFGRPSIPFVWQSERRLLLLDEEAALWTLAELEFEPKTCRYVEIRRAAYEMEREAVGALLSRALGSGMNAVEESATHLNDWLIRNFGHSLHESRSKPRSRAI